MTRGPLPKPTHLKLISGTARKDRMNKREPKPEIKVPSCPDFLDEEAKREWRRITPQLKRLRIISRIDRAMLASYCQAWSRWKRAEEAIRQHGEVFITPNGFVQKRPEVTIARESMLLMEKAAQHFGLSPASRTRVKAASPLDDDFTDFMDRK